MGNWIYKGKIINDINDFNQFSIDRDIFNVNYT